MGHTNETANVELSQFLGTDKPAWLVDYNGDMAKIDAYAYATKVKADANESAITSLGNRVTTVENDVTNTITPALTAAQNNITTLQGNITTINSLIGNGTPTTTDQTIIGAINEINSNLTNALDIKSDFEAITFSSVADDALGVISGSIDLTDKILVGFGGVEPGGAGTSYMTSGRLKSDGSYEVKVLNKTGSAATPTAKLYYFYIDRS